MKRAVFAVAITAALAANAQELNAFDGAWVAEWNTPNGRPASAVLNLRDGGGTWQNRVLGRTDDPCPKVTAPAKVEASGEETFLSINRSAVIAGCSNSRMKLTKPEAGSIKGNWADGREVVLKKQ